MGKGNSRRVRMTAAERRAQLLQVARELFAQRGYEATSVEEIAERAGVSKPVVYEHFGGKDGVYAVLVDREVRTLVERIAASLDADHPREALDQAAAAFMLYIEEEADGFRMLVRDAPVGTGSPTYASLLDDIAGRVTDVLASHFDARGYDTGYAPLYARALVGMVALVGEWWLHAGGLRRRDVEAHVVNLAWNGLKDLDRAPTR